MKKRRAIENQGRRPSSQSKQKRNAVSGEKRSRGRLKKRPMGGREASRLWAHVWAPGLGKFSAGKYTTWGGGFFTGRMVDGPEEANRRSPRSPKANGRGLERRSGGDGSPPRRQGENCSGGKMRRRRQRTCRAEGLSRERNLISPGGEGSGGLSEGADGAPGQRESGVAWKFAPKVFFGAPRTVGAREERSGGDQRLCRNLKLRTTSEAGAKEALTRLRVL